MPSEVGETEISSLRSSIEDQTLITIASRGCELLQMKRRGSTGDCDPISLDRSYGRLCAICSGRRSRQVSCSFQ